jgi:fatty acid desaturase
VKKAMQLLRFKQDRRTLGFVVSFFVGAFVLWTMELPWWATAPIYAWILLMACVGAVINHNALHSPVFKRKWMNRALHVLLTFIYGMPVTLFVPVHNLSHHKHAQSSKDVMRSMKLRSKWNLLNVLRAPSLMAVDTIKDDLRYFRVQKRKGATIYRYMRLEFVLLLVYGVTLLALDFRTFLWLVFIPWQVSQGFIVGINFVQHDGCDPDQSGYNHSRNLTGRVFNWFFLNNGFHTIHHRRPGLHWSKAREAHDEEVAPRMHPSLAQENSLTFFCRYFFAPGTRRTYLGEPYVPSEPGPDEPWFYETDETYSAV